MSLFVNQGTKTVKLSCYHRPGKYPTPFPRPGKSPNSGMKKTINYNISPQKRVHFFLL